MGAVLAGSYIASGPSSRRLSGRVDPALTGHIEGRFNLLRLRLALPLHFSFLVKSLWFYGRIYRLFQTGDILKAIEEDYEVDGHTYGGNAAAGIALAGNLVAYG